VSSCRLVTCATASAGERVGPAGHTLGHASLTWACSAAAVLCLRHHPAGQQDLARVESRPGNGKAWTVRAHQRARAGSYRLKRQTAFEWDTCLPEAWSGGDAPAASRDAHGMRLTRGGLVELRGGGRERSLAHRPVSLIPGL
jgi:hypothetical protein